MYSSVRFIFLGILFLVQSCTGQKPADFKNSTIPKRAIKASCSKMQFEGQILSKKNVLNIFDCSGWGKQYPDLNKAIQNASEISVNKALKVFNDSFFSSRSHRKAFYKMIAEAEARGELSTLATLLEKSLKDHKILNQVSKVLNKEHISLAERSDFMQIFSNENDENIKTVTALKHLAEAYELNKKDIDTYLNEDMKTNLTPKVENLLNDFSREMESSSWNHVSNIVYYEGFSPLQEWTMKGLDSRSDRKALLNVIESPNFVKDIRYLKNSLNTGIKCTNRANTQDFNINVAQELKQKIEGLKVKDQSEFREMLLHGLTKYLAFQEFCEEKSRQQGIDSFFQVIRYAYKVIPSYHDFEFLKTIHQIFGEDRFVFLSFISSDTFGSLRDLFIELEAEELDDDFVKSLYQIMIQLSPDDLEVISDLFGELGKNNSKSQVWYRSWGKLWDGLSSDEKQDFIRFLGIFLNKDINASETLSILQDLLKTFPAFSEDMSRSLSDENYQESLRYLIDVLGEPKAQQDLARLLSKKGLFEFIEILTQEYEKPVRPSVKPEPIVAVPTSYSEEPQSMQIKATKVCFESLISTYQQNTDYYNLVNTLPESCLNVLGEVGFVGQIYLWMYNSEAFFKKRGIQDFHSGTGVWAPGMLQFIFSAAVKADYALLSEGGKKGILENLDSVEATLTDERIAKTVYEFSRLYKVVDSKLILDPRFANFFNSTDDNVLNQLSKDGFSLLAESESVVDINARPISCADVSPELGVNPCISNDKIKEQLLDMVRILRQPNEKNVTLLKEIIHWLHPKGGVDLPFGKKTTNTHKASLDEVIRFLHDLSSEKTLKEFIYDDGKTSRKVKGSVLDRLEVVIRDISFSNNFYGAYFKNDVAGASNYRKDVTASEKLLVMLDQSSGIFRTFGGMPKNSKYRLKNVRQTYSSLIEVDDEYVQADGSVRRYGPFTQSLLAMVVKSSKVSTQDFNPYRVPSEKVVEGHNGWFLTKTVQMSGLRHLSGFVRARFDDNLSALNTAAFKKINENLIARHDLKKLQNGAQDLLDKYLDNGDKQINQILIDTVDFVRDLDTEEEKLLEEIVVKGLILLSDDKISVSNIEKAGPLIESIIKHWHQIRKIFFGLKSHRSDFLELMNDFMDGLVQYPEELDRVITTIDEANLLNLKDLDKLFDDEKENEFVNSMISFLNQIIQVKKMDSDLNWHQTMQAIFTSKGFEWEALKAWFKVAYANDKSKLTVSVLIEVLGEVDQDGNHRFQVIMEELFKNHREQLEQFLRETFKALELKPD